ncbi:MAG: hypothetical protein J6A75_09520 [Lachnospiraceae bacterium]|nr:hypothetical protein [Lachnospiraceae bacterium]
MSVKTEIFNITEDTITAYFDLEFCNERISRHNVPIAIGVSYRCKGKEIGSYYSLIWYSDEMELWKEQLDNIGYTRRILKDYGKSMKTVTEELLEEHEKYQPKLYVSFGKQDETLLKKFVTESLEDWNFCDAIQWLNRQLSMKHDISLEKYAYICHLDFIHDFDPLEDAQILAEIIWCVLQNQEDNMRKEEVIEEYERKLFLIQYRNKQQAYMHLSSLDELSIKQKEKMQNHAAYLAKNMEKYEAYMKESDSL